MTEIPSLFLRTSLLLAWSNGKPQRTSVPGDLGEQKNYTSSRLVMAPSRRGADSLRSELAMFGFLSLDPMFAYGLPIVCTGYLLWFNLETLT